MKATTATGPIVLAWAFAAAAAEPGAMGTPNHYDFDTDPAGKPPPGFTFVPNQTTGKWRVEAQKDAASAGHVLGQLEKQDAKAPDSLAVTTGVFHSDVRVSVKCKTVPDQAEQGCGLVFRYVDEDNHYLTASSVREKSVQNVRLYQVKNGKRTPLGTWEGKAAGNLWNELAAEVKGDTLRVYLNGQKLIEAKDRTFRAGGKAGMWAKANANANVYFDDFNVTSM